MTGCGWVVMERRTQPILDAKDPGHVLGICPLRQEVAVEEQTMSAVRVARLRVPRPNEPLALSRIDKERLREQLPDRQSIQVRQRAIREAKAEEALK